MMAPFGEQAHQLVSEAEKKLSATKGFLSFLIPKKAYIEDAIELYQKAGNLFKLSKNWSQSGAAFKIAADLNRSQHQQMEAAQNLTSAAKCYEKFDIKVAVNYLLTAINIYLDLGRFLMAAKLHHHIADVYEEHLNFREAIEHYEQAVDLYKTQESYVAANRCQLKMAQHLSADLYDFVKAGDLFEAVADHDLGTPILKYNVKENFFKAILCFLCFDCLTAKQKIVTYVERHPTFSDSREHKFLQKLISCIEGEDENGFTETIEEFDAISRLDKWHVKVLLQIREKIRETNLL